MKRKILIAILVAVAILASIAVYASRDAGWENEGIQPRIDGKDIRAQYENIGQGLKSHEGILYNPNLGGPFNGKIYIKAIEQENGFYPENIKWLKAKVSSSSPEYYIYQDDGPSGDPHFAFFVKNDQNIYEDMGSTPTGLKIPGDGFLYTKSRSNELFTAIRKYTVNESGRIEEIPQELMSVHIVTNVNTSITLYKNSDAKDGDEKDVVATLKPGSEVYVIAFSEGESGSIFGSFLVKTSDGKFGWIPVDSKLAGQCIYDDATHTFRSAESPLQDICFAGD